MVGRLALMLANRGRHRHNPEFVDDVIATIGPAGRGTTTRLYLLLADGAAPPPARAAG